MKSSLIGLLIAVCLTCSTSFADPNDLSGGAFIAHYAQEIEYTLPPPGGGWCRFYKDTYAISACESQANRSDNFESPSIWFVLAAWNEPKDWRGIQFGLGDYSTQDYVIWEHGPCFPSQGLTLPLGDWPDPNTGIALATGDDTWSGNFIPVYYFVGMPYASERVSIVAPYHHDYSFVGASNWFGEFPFAEENLGSMGFGTGGTWVCPLDDPLGNCCFLDDDTCQYVTQSECEAAEGYWMGAQALSCDPIPCRNLGACCTDEGCLVLPLFACMLDYNGTWFGGEECSDAVCDDLRACCIDGMCFLKTQYRCESRDGEWYPESFTCTPDPCADRALTSPGSWGAIKALYR